MNHFRILLCLFAALQLTSYAAEPVEDFAKGFLPKVDEQYWWGFDERKPPGGYLVRFEQDITGDGQSEVFVASSLEANEEFYTWSIYSPNAQQDYTMIASDVAIPPDQGFYLMTFGTQRELQTVYKNAKFGLGVIDRYAIPANGAVTLNKQELSTEQLVQLDASNWREVFSIGDGVKPTITKILLAEYANNQAVQWRPYKPALGILDQNTDPADASAIAAHINFTFQSAKQLFDIP